MSDAFYVSMDDNSAVSINLVCTVMRGEKMLGHILSNTTATMDILPDDIKCAIVESIDSRFLLHIRITSHWWKTAANKVLERRHWTDAFAYGDAIRIHMVRGNRACFRFMLRHAMSQRQCWEVAPTANAYSFRQVCHRSENCSKITKKGAQCRRRHTAHSLYCWQHSRNAVTFQKKIANRNHPCCASRKNKCAP